MNADTLAPQELIRKAVIEVAQLQENELLIVIEMVDSLKKQRAHPNKELAVEILAKAKARAEEVRYLSRDEAMEKFSKTLDAIREDAIAKGTAIDGEVESG
jgi:cell division protein FtsX